MAYDWGPVLQNLLVSNDVSCRRFGAHTIWQRLSNPESFKPESVPWNDLFTNVKTVLFEELDLLKKQLPELDRIEQHLPSTNELENTGDVEKLFRLASKTVECAKNFQYNVLELENVLDLVVAGLDQPFRRRHFQHNFLSFISSSVASNPYFMQTISKEQWKAVHERVVKCPNNPIQFLMDFWSQGNRHGAQWTFDDRSFVVRVLNSTLAVVQPGDQEFDHNYLPKTIQIVSKYCQQRAQTNPWDSLEVFQLFVEKYKTVAYRKPRFDGIFNDKETVNGGCFVHPGKPRYIGIGEELIRRLSLLMDLMRSFVCNFYNDNPSTPPWEETVLTAFIR
ncbi:unnamed protein product [Cyprideis torosa]|uniref:Uncharacterized protein n=1 Tax=Cyprideis torosa TaxID=163714 RepID=A0A7R8WE66_9CRUS|nr:unnamed protein product [Cyprideis torosa]CAG0895405.1 unnamed protein product [Cyprideis torosa]